MRDELLQYYEKELAYLRLSGAAFAERYPKIASRLLLDQTATADPHVERLLEAFAFLAARVHLKLDDDFSEISEALLSVVAPHALRPIPAMSIAQLTLDPEQGKLTTGLAVPRGSALYTKPVKATGAPCRFRTCYDTTLWPLTVTRAQWRSPDQLSPPVTGVSATGALRVELQCLPDVRFDKLELKKLRLHLHGVGSLVPTLYEVLCNNTVEIHIRDIGSTPPRKPVVLPPSALRPVGFEPDEGTLPLQRRSLLAYRLLQEYFTFPEKFFFLDVSGFDQARAAGFGSRAEVIFLVSSFERGERREDLEKGVSEDTVLLGCTPIVNLFTQDSEPVAVTPAQTRFPLVADARRRESTRVFSVDEVVAATPGAPDVKHLEALYSIRHGGEGPQSFWYARPTSDAWGDKGTPDLELSFVDRAGRDTRPPVETVTARLTCFNGKLADNLTFQDDAGDLTLPGGGPIQKIVGLTKPTRMIAPPLGKSVLWRLISQLAINYFSLVEGGADTLKEILRLHNAGDSVAGEKQIQGILDVRGAPCYARIEGEHGLSFARGHRVEITLDEEQFAGGSVYLFASVLERFLGVYTTLNSFSVLAVRTRQRKEVLREWPARAGVKALV